ncbi:hypothetical protein ASPFODRAFT_54337 [Aspergillus luchuensis CBS 106.47]|uniref:Uncharacterized protein n=1 Tax=Aspergillus luchuensis (strain CBS 106.47) TaxID=1137211 RepID=A0A1M3SZK7_ASPLC|nr:hypothetical protein ASPFODRAFT_54337 [Aspergillus luchuensis CBS 106.47]
MKAMISLGCRVSYQVSGVTPSSGSKEVALTLFGPPKFLASKRFKEILDILAKRGLFLQRPVRHDIKIPYENPQWLKLDMNEGTSFILGGKWYCRKVMNDPRYHSEPSCENERAVFP